jgi:AraC family transcriptional regulator
VAVGCGSREPPVNTPDEPGEGAKDRLLVGAQTYQHVLSGAGGREMDALRQSRDGMLIYAAVYGSPPYRLNVPALNVPRISINLTPARVSGGIEGDRSRSFDARRHSVFATPAGQPVTWCKESPSRHLSIYFHADIFDGADDSPRLRPLPALFNAAVPGIGPLVDALVSELQSPGILNVEASDSLARLLLIRLARHQHSAESAPNLMTPKAVAVLRDYVLAHLGERILVADMARQIGLSPNRFALSFAQRAGQTPHRFVLALRVERAAEMLSRTDSSLADIAHACGFASQQHMSNALRSLLGVTPSSLRPKRAR